MVSVSMFVTLVSASTNIQLPKIEIYGTQQVTDEIVMSSAIGSIDTDNF